jgi:hypothetical protein
MKDLIGKTILVKGYRGDNLPRVIRVTSVRDTLNVEDNQQLRLKTMWDNRITRGRYAITGKVVTRNVFRTYYVDHLDDAKLIGWLGLTWHRMLVYLGIRETKVD